MLYRGCSKGCVNCIFAIWPSFQNHKPTLFRASNDMMMQCDEDKFVEQPFVTSPQKLWLSKGEHIVTKIIF